MCGIAGLADFSRDLRDEEAVLRAMTGTMACRGPDAEGRWLDTHAAVGHRRLAVIDLAGSTQPMVAGSVVLTYSGELYNFRELRAELVACGHRFRTRGDTEVVLRAYLEWGEGFVDRLTGMYAFAVWDQRTEQLLLVRDRLGVKPLYYHRLGGGVVFGSEPKALLASGRVPRTVDADGIREVFGLVNTPGRGLVGGMVQVRPGELVRVTRAGLTRRRYWRLTAREHRDDWETTVATVRKLLADAVTGQLVADVPVCVLASGGIDSSAVAALAGRDSPTFSVRFGGGFRPDAMRETEDEPYVRALVRHLGTRHTDVVVGNAEATDEGVRAAALRAREFPTALVDMDTSLYQLFGAVRRDCTVALSGEAADEVFGGYRWFTDPRFAGAATFPWIAMVRQASTPSALFDPRVFAGLDVTGYQDEAYREALADVPVLDGEPAGERRMREVGHLFLSRFLPGLLDRKDRISMAHGLEVRVPFCDHRLVEYVFNVPWAMKTRDGREKSVLRAAVADLLPAAVLDRPKTPYPSTQDPDYEVVLRKRVRAMLDRDDTPVRPLLAADAGGRVEVMNRFEMDLALQIDDWLAAFDLRLTL
ncbi:asparagine synthase (glutamine-hydrolyzing) [Amycolatopsis sp. A133]|uniref:asparagine synthase (glutamine-hydrolyzing) n=1 Tax=Amycolatopsis sp. A133 TaxID=3064472 RepID=UPI0027FBA5F1|nr:asparagine synthase (glutamine-hydrolyzing) [Amycolatopsis sp. A133]MDQ7803499.1 asparagine synthase (glutamine-hydrolyzing) [Amycolatopsis sp. A133]